jgi:hypothetical protein
MGWPIDPEEDAIFVDRSNCTIAAFEDPTQRLSVSNFSVVIELTIGQIFQLN